MSTLRCNWRWVPHAQAAGPAGCADSADMPGSHVIAAGTRVACRRCPRRSGSSGGDAGDRRSWSPHMSCNHHTAPIKLSTSGSEALQNCLLLLNLNLRRAYS